MTSPIESLTNELFDMIIVHLISPEIANLLRCSTHLQHRLEPVLYGQKSQSDRAMHWACLKGVNNTIRRAALYGASITVSEVTRQKWSWEWDSNLNDTRRNWVSFTVKQLTFYLATKRGHLETFKLLLELGARLDDSNVDRKQVMRLLKFLCMEGNTSILCLLFESGVYAQIKSVSAADWCLTRIIKNATSPDLVRLLLDCGADPNHVEVIGKQRLSPISAAIIANSMPVFDLLLDRGADINGKDYHCPSALLPWNIPIFAAAQSMAKNGIIFLQKCLHNGANINHTAHLFRSRKSRGSNYLCSTPTPIYVYLDSINNWDVAQAIAPFKGLTFLLENGASLEFPTITHDSPYCSWRGFREPAMYETLLDKRGPKYLAVPEFFRTLELFTQKGISNEDFIRLSLKYKYDSKGQKSDLVIQGWKSLLLVLLQNKKTVEKGQLFVTYIDRMGKDNYRKYYPISSGIKPDPPRNLGSIQLATVDALVDSGIDINCRKDDPDGGTALHNICWVENFEESRQRIYRSCHFGDFPTRRYAEETQELVQLLMNKGANPMSLYQGKTTFEILLCNDEKFTKEGKEYILGLVDIMRRGVHKLEIRD